MTEQRLRANQKFAGQACGWCGKELALGEETVVCGACRSAHHAACWDQQRGCAAEGCESAPLKQLEPDPAAPAPAGKAPRIEQKKCPHCGHRMARKDKVCRHCKRAPTPDGIYRGRRDPAPHATASLVFGILGLFICGLIFGILAISKASEAEKAIARDPTLTGAGKAKAGKILGIIALIGWGLIVLSRLMG